MIFYLKYNAYDKNASASQRFPYPLPPVPIVKQTWNAISMST